MDRLIIGIDYGIARGDTPFFTVAKQMNDKIHIIDAGEIDNFDYSKYVATEHQIIGEKSDLELFKKQFGNQLTTKSEGVKKRMDKQKALEVYNSMEIVESESDGESMICIHVENSHENREKLISIGFSETEIDNALYDYLENKDVIDLNHFVWNCAEWFDGKKFLDHNPNDYC